MSACKSGTRGSGVLSSTGDVLVRGVGGVCDMCMCLARGGVGGEGGEWIRQLGLGFTNPLGTGGVGQNINKLQPTQNTALRDYVHNRHEHTSTRITGKATITIPHTTS